MKQKLQLLLAMLLMAATGAWADTTFSPTAEAQFRTTDASNATWDNTYVKNASDKTEFEVNYKAGIFVLHTYEVTDLAAVKSLTLYLTGDKNMGTDAVAIWAFPTTEWSTSSDAATIAGYVNSTVGVDLHAESGSYSSTYLLKDMHTSSTSDGDIRFRKFDITGTQLEALKARANGNKFTLLITNRTTDLLSNSKRTMYTSSHATEAYRPYVSVQYVPAVVTEDTKTTLCETLNAAYDAITSSGTITLYDDITITNRCNSGAKTINVVPNKDGIKITSALTNSIWFLTQNGATVNIGSDSYQLIIDGNNATNSSCFVECGNNSNSTTFNNVKFLNCKTSASAVTGSIICYKANGGSLYLKNVELNGCAATSSNCSLVFYGLNDLNIQGGLTINNCSADCDIYVENNGINDKILKVKEMTEAPASPIRLKFKTTTLKTIALSTSYTDMTSWFKVLNDDFGLAYQGSNGDNVLTEAYEQNINTYGASTLILPYEATIPENVKAYTLNYTAGASTVVATEQSNTIPANTPVLLNAETGAYKFVNTSIVESNTVGSGTHTVGALTGVYASTPVPAGSYILWANAGNPIGFYKANNNTVGANRAYLTAEGASTARLSVSFDEVETTGIESAKQVFESDAIYNLQGVRVDRPTKGIYVKNGKKYFVK